MNSLRVWLQSFVLFIFYLASSSCCTHVGVAALSPHSHSHSHRYHKPIIIKGSQDDDDFRTLFYSQTLDHFNYRPDSYATFQQKYIINSKHWGGAQQHAPIFVNFGGESPLQDNDVYGFLTDHADEFKALLLYTEHRFYGRSIPFGLTFEQALKNESVRGYFNSEQAIADYAELILQIKQELNASDCPVIVIGGSYPGMLASWFRLKYPHIAIGALASSAPILYFDDIVPADSYYAVVTKDFRETSESCYKAIRESWDEIDRVGSTSDGLLNLTNKFKTCTPLNKSSELKDFLDNIYSLAAQYNQPTVDSVCKAIGDGSDGSDLLTRIYRAVLVYSKNSITETENQLLDWDCHDVYYVNHNPTQPYAGWAWQTCSEMVMPSSKGTSPKSNMYQPLAFDLNNFTKECKDNYNVVPRPHWITTYYGGQHIKTVLKKFGSNIIFSNGLRDPYSSAGVLETISDSIFALYTKNGTHCSDIVPAASDDPEWLVEQRREEVRVIAQWIKEYNAEIETQRAIKIDLL